MGKYVVRDSKNGQFYFTLHADNGEVILTSETYTTKGAAFGGINSCKENSPHESQYIRNPANGGQFTFALKAKNNERIGASERYTSEAAREVGISSCKRNGPSSPVVDESRQTAANR